MKQINRKLLSIDLFTDQELMTEAGKYLVFDIECYLNYFLIAFKSIESEKVVYFELSPDSVINIPKLMWMLRSFILIGFNSRNYDIPLAWLACTGASNANLKACSDASIKEELRPYDLEKRFGFRIFGLNHIDLIEVAPLKGSLKLYAGRLHAPRLQDLPYAPDQVLTREEALQVRHYCVNDLDCTRLLYTELCPQIRLREQLGEVYGQDLRSKSDAQIAETVIRSEVQKLTGPKLERPRIAPGTAYKYVMPDYIRYESKVLREVQERVRKASFVVTEKGSVKMPPELGGGEIGSSSKKGKGYCIKIGSSVYKIGIGGLHSQEEMVRLNADKDTWLIDRDVSSYYPNIIINLGLFPNHLGTEFLEVYRTIVSKRLQAKKEGDKIIADSLKIVVNSSFGKFGNKYSILYSPDLMIQVTITGQLVLLMLIERIELSGIPVMSGNTDGIVIKCPRDRYDDLNAIINMWEEDTRFVTEETRYKAVYSENVNNYLAHKENDTFKGKGKYKEVDLSKNPSNLICNDAVKAMILNSIPVEDTIRNCNDITRFVTIRNVKGGAQKDGCYLGKVIRWYYAKRESGTINYILSGNKVPRSDGAIPMMDLPESMPNNLNYQWYIDEANAILRNIAFYDPPKKAKQISFF